MSEILHVDAVSRRFGGYLALNNVSCTVVEGHVHALIGPNGAGKTTLFNIVSGVLRPTSGRITFVGEDYIGDRPDRVLSRGIARNFQQVRLMRDLSVVENVMIGAHARMNRGLLGNMLEFLGSATAEKMARDSALSMIEFVGLVGKAHAAPGDLTLVDQRRVEIARALASGPKLLLLDEPAAGMNQNELAEFSVLVRSIRDKGLTILLVEHNMRLVMNVADRITVMSAGSIIAEGSPQAVQRDPAVVAAYLGGGDESPLRP
jgi:ABC-type branched-subunit amino acid transport system ATPase component